MRLVIWWFLLGWIGDLGDFVMLVLAYGVVRSVCLKFGLSEEL